MQTSPSIGLLLAAFFSCVRGYFLEQMTMRPLVKPLTEYHAEYRDLFRQSMRPIDRAGQMATYGILPSGTVGDLPDHPDITATILGDSFAAPFAAVFDDIARERGMKFTMTSIPSCAAFFDSASLDENVRDWPGARADDMEKVLCKRERRREMLALAKATPARIIFVAANWIATPQLWTAHRSLGSRDPVAETLLTMAATGKRVVVIGMVPGSHYDARECVQSGVAVCPAFSRVEPPFDGSPDEMERMRNRQYLRGALARTMARADIQAHNVGFVDPRRALCVSEALCKVMQDGQLLYSDTKHLTAVGARLMRKDIENALYEYGRY